MLCLSTCWNSHRHTCGRAMINEIRELGFRWVELSHGLPVSMLPGILKAVEAGEISVAGVHNFFPSPVEVSFDAPDIYEFTSHLPIERRRALDLTRKSFDMAQKFRAKYIVLHMGSIPSMRSHRWTKSLEKLAKNGERGGETFDKELANFLKKRERAAASPWKRASSVLMSLQVKAKECGLIMAVESRSHGEQIPTEKQFFELFPENETRNDQSTFGYWHDFGHVQRKHNLNILDHVEYFKRMLPWLVGCHVHDTHFPARDHRVPFAGEIPFEEMIPLIPKNLPLTWELSPRQTTEQIKIALEKWREKFAQFDFN